MKKRVIIFDFFGVISDKVAIVWVKNNFPENQVEEIKEKYIRAVDAGTISETELFEGLGKLVSRSSSEVRDEWHKLAIIDLEVVAIIKKLKVHHKVALCSDASYPFLRQLIKENNLESLFDEIVVSSEVKLTKPNPLIFKMVLEHVGVLPEEAIFIDDSEENVKGATEIGIKSLLFKNPGDLGNELMKTGIVF